MNEQEYKIMQFQKIKDYLLSIECYGVHKWILEDRAWITDRWGRYKVDGSMGLLEVKKKIQYGRFSNIR